MPPSLSPPPAFRGTFRTDDAALSEAAGSRGPVWIRPAAVARPADADDVSRLVGWAGAEGVALIPRAGATGMPGGNVGAGVVMDLGGLHDMGPPDPATGLMEVGAGAVAGAADDLAREHRRHLAALPSSASWCTVGGMAACDAAGARSFRHGPVHAQVAALEVVESDGSRRWVGEGHAPAGPWPALHRRVAAELGTLGDWPAVRKNASGYALDRFLATGDAAQLLVGSEGTLAVVTRVRLRTRPLPRRRGGGLVGIPDLALLPDIARAADQAGASACELFGRRIVELGGLDRHEAASGLACDHGLLLLEFEGSAAAVEEGLAEATRLGRYAGGAYLARDAATLDQLWELRHEASPSIAALARDGRRSMQFVEDSVVPLKGVPAYLGGVEEILARHGTDHVAFGHAGDGNLHVNPLVDVTDADWLGRVRSILDEVAALVAGLGGTLSGEHGDGRVRAPLLSRIWSPRLVSAFRTVKNELDPRGILNPGVVLPLPDQDPLDGLAAGPDRQLAHRQRGAPA